jgi:hypothetical protein
MTLYRRSSGLAQDLLVSGVARMMRGIFLFCKRERRRPRMVPRVGYNNNSRREVSNIRI